MNRNPSRYRNPSQRQNPEPEPIPEPDELELETADTRRTSRSAEPAEPEEGSLEFDATATDVSEIFISPSQAEHDTGSGNYEAVVLAEDPPPELAPTPAEEPAPESDEPSHTDTIAADDWSLLDDDEPPADAESVIEESPLAQEAEPGTWCRKRIPPARFPRATPRGSRKCSRRRKPRPVRTRTAERRDPASGRR